MPEPETTPIPNTPSGGYSRSTRLCLTLAPVGLVVAAVAVGMAGPRSDLGLEAGRIQFFAEIGRSFRRLFGGPCLGPNARRTKIVSDLQTIQKVATGIYTETGTWPESIEAMVNARDANGRELMNALDDPPTDPWGNEYHYSLTDGGVVVSSWGRDNAPGGEGEAEDVVRPEASNK